jgi:hypothetical protein
MHRAIALCFVAAAIAAAPVRSIAQADLEQAHTEIAQLQAELAAGEERLAQLQKVTQQLKVSLDDARAQLAAMHVENAHLRQKLASASGDAPRPALQASPQTRLRQLREEMAKLETDQVRRKLAQPLPVDFDQNALENVVTYFQNVAGVNIFVDWPSLQAAGVARDAPVSLSLANVPVDKALDLVLDTVAGQAARLDRVIENNVLIISTAASIARRTVIRTYDVSSLARDVQDSPVMAAQRIDHIRRLIQQNVGPVGYWGDVGGTWRITTLGGKLVVQASPKAHDQIDALLAKLGASR